MEFAMLMSKLRKIAGDTLPSKGSQRRSTEGKIPCVCGGIMMTKNGKYGEFLGCNKYPSCRETRNIKK